MTNHTRSTRALYGQYVAEVNDAASLAAAWSPARQGVANPRSAFWIAFGQVARGRHGRAGRRWGDIPAGLGRRLWRAALRLTSGW
jgi:hypothetical protein